jgi:hypothetical protein
MNVSQLLRLSTILAMEATLSLSAEITEIDFGRDVRPLLTDKCFHCHGPDESTRQSSLRLDEWESASGVISVDAPDSSELIRRILSEDPDEVMPPPSENKPLSNSEVEMFKNWIRQGAQWTGHWAYEAPQRWPIPQLPSDLTLKLSGHLSVDLWPLNWIDHFILDGLQQRGLLPAPQSDPLTLWRRLHIDLTGLPPDSPSDESNCDDRQQYGRRIDLLLSSPHYGERMASYWLDLVRYADTVGYHGDQDHHISAYRDWVIEAFNASYPFDSMTRDQLAGDLVDHPTVDQRVASGYNRLLQTTHEGGLQPGEYRAIYAADRVRNLTDVWLAASVGCAQCHDHKFDPYTMKDFYSFAAFFADVDDESHFKNGTNALPTSREPELELPTEWQSSELSELSRQIADLDEKLKGDLTSQEIAKVTKERRNVERERQRLRSGIRRSMITVSLQTPRETRILPRGDWMDGSGQVVSPAFPDFLSRYTAGEGWQDNSRRLNRTDLAHWLTCPQEGVGLLTARVIVNRIWYLFFGRGLAADLTDFGGQGEFPSHLKLLDNLAYHLIDHDWDLKATVRLIVSSRTYQQSSTLSAGSKFDVENSGFGRQQAYRMPAETIRDNALAVSQLLTREVGGDTSRPYQPAGYFRHLNFPEREYQPDMNQQQWRRGVYMHWQRQFLHPMLKAFDATNREECTAQRDRSNTPVAALTLLNDPTFVEAARALAERMLRETSSTLENTDQLRVQWLFEKSTGRASNAMESAALCRLLQESRDTFAIHPEKAELLLSVGILPTRIKIAPGELAAWAEVSRAILNLAEVSMRQ